MDVDLFELGRRIDRAAVGVDERHAGPAAFDVPLEQLTRRLRQATVEIVTEEVGDLPTLDRGRVRGSTVWHCRTLYVDAWSRARDSSRLAGRFLRSAPSPDGLASAATRRSTRSREAGGQATTSGGPRRPCVPCSRLPSASSSGNL